MPSEVDSLSSPSEEPGFRLPRTIGDHPGQWAALVSGVIYLTLGLLLLAPRGAPPSPELGPPLSTLTALANGLTFLFLTLGWIAIRAGNRVRHRALMELAFVSIVSFLALYVTRQLLSGTLSFGGPESLYVGVYVPLLVVHLAVSTTTVPLVVYNFLIGLSRPFSQVGATPTPEWVGSSSPCGWQAR